MEKIRMNKKLLISVLCLMLALALLAGCSNQAAPPAGDAPPADTQEPPTEPADEPQQPTERTLTDMAGRSVTLPAEVETGFGTGAIGSYMLYTMDPTTMVGVNYEFNDAEKAYILEAYRDLPAYGQSTGLNLEAVIAAAPDVLIAYGTISDTEIENSDSIQQQTGIPVIMLDGELTAVPAAYRMLGEIFGQQERTEALAAYAEEALAFAAAQSIPEAERLSVYYGNGLENLETAPQGSWHAELLEVVQARNVAVLEGELTARIDVSAEQVLAWDPQVVLLNGEPQENVSPTDAVANFLADSRYRNLQAVQNGTVYAIPKYPYSWFDRPPGPNRLIGIYWLGSLLYPELYPVDIKAEAREFYALYYHLELSDEQLMDLLGF